MKRLISLALLVLIGCQSTLFALAFDKDKLMALDPLCSERVAHQGREFQNNRWWANLGLGLAMTGIVWNNSGGLSDDAKLGNLIQGFTLLSTGVILYFTSGDPVVQDDILQKLDLQGIEKEEVAYSIMKYNVARSKVTRENSSLILMAIGLGYAGLTFVATKASQPYREVMYLSAAFYFFQGFWAGRHPGQNEKDMEKIDLMVGTK